MRSWAFVLAVAFLGAGCLTPGGDAVLLDVPFRVQNDTQCGLQALEMVLDYWRVPFDDRQLAQQVLIPALKGTVPDLLVEAARQRGLPARVARGDLQLLKACLSQGTPPIVFWGPPDRKSEGHFVVVTGIRVDNSSVRVHSGKGRNHWCTQKDFLLRWQRSGTKTVIIGPVRSAGDSSAARRTDAPRS